MKYLICQEYTNTTDNHAGMKHMCNLLKKNYPDDYEIIVFPDLYQKVSRNEFIRKIQNFLIKKFIVSLQYLLIIKELKSKLKDNDSFFLLEYCELLFPQLILSRKLNSSSKNIKIFGLIHLVPEKLEVSFSHKTLLKWIQPLDNVITFGSSLTDYIKYKFNIQDNKVITLFHYVDLDFYKPLINNINTFKKVPPSIIIMGNQKRNYDLLFEIVNENPELTFTICQGVMDLSEKFIGCKNAKLIGFIKEDELLYLMQTSDISLNIMEDTVGSNVVTTSMAVGLAMIVSDVGSIRDYCKDDGAIYCKNDVKSFSNALKDLCNDQEKLNKFKEKSILYSKSLSIHKFNDLINKM
jgi:glycosyltransferase involved in cell wall biosynthesis